jgi:Rha family phage regulatory protein
MKRKELKIKLVFQTNGKLKTDSLIMAKVFEKEHKNVMRDIRNLECSSEFRKLNFELTDYVDKNGDSQPKYEMSRDGFMFLAMGFTGTKAAQWKESVINAFNIMEAELLKQVQQQFMPRGYPQMLEAARNNWKQVRNELIDLLSTHLQVYDRKRKSQFTNQIYLDLIETTARRLRDHFLLTRPNQLTRDYLHQLVQESIVEIEIRLSDALMSGSITTWEEFKNELEQMADHIRYMKELQNGRISLPQYAYPIVNNMQTH